jgi:hypothetical protein
MSRVAEIAAHTASVIAVATTLLVVDVVPGAETNPVAAWLIAQVGLVPWALATPVAVAGAFALLRLARRRESPDDRLRTAHLGGLVAAGLGLDAGGNLLALATHATGWTVPWATVGVEAGAVALLAGLLVVRPDPRRVVGIAVEATDGVEREHVAAGAVALLVVFSSLGGVVGPLSTTDQAEAASTISDPSSGTGNTEVFLVNSSQSDTTSLYNTDTGQFEWATQTPNGDNVELVERVYGGVAVGDTGGYVTLLDPSDGSTVWQTKLNNGNGIGTIDGDSDGNVYVAVDIGGGGAGTIAKLNASGGVEWETANNGYTDVIYVPSTNEVWAISQDASPEVVEIFNAKNGNKITTTSLEYKSGLATDGENVAAYSAGDQVVGLIDAEARSASWTGTTPSNSGSIEISQNYVYIVDAFNEDLIRFDKQGGNRVDISPSPPIQSDITGAYESQFYYRDGDSSGNLVRFDLASNSTTSYSGTGYISSITINGDGPVEAGPAISGTVRDQSGDPVADATVDLRQSGSTVASTTSNSSGGYAFSGVSDGDYTVRALAPGYDTATKDIVVNGTDRTADIQLQDSSPPYLSAASPRGGFLNLTTSSVSLAATVADDDGDTINATIYYNDGSGDGFQPVSSVSTVASGTEISATVQPEFGLPQRWKVEVSDGATTRNSSTYSFTPPGKLVFLNATDATLADDATITVTFADADGAWTETRTASDGQVNLTGLPQPWVVTAVQPQTRYQDRSILIHDRATAYFPLLYESGQSGTYQQCFNLDDFTGSFPPTQTGLVLEKRVNNSFEEVASQPFGPSGTVCFTLKDGAEYRVVVINLGGDRRSTGGYTGNQSKDRVRLPIYDRGTGDAIRTTAYRWDAYWTMDSNGDRDNIAFTYNLSAGVGADDLALRIHERGNRSNVIHQQQFGVLAAGANVSHLQMLSDVEENQSWVVAWEGNLTTDNQSATLVSGQRVLGAGGQDQWPGLPAWIGQWVGMGLLLMTGASVSRLDLQAGLVIVPALAGLLWFTGLFTSSVLTGGAVVLALGLGIMLSQTSEDPI